MRPWLVAEPPQRKRQRRGGGRVKPLDIVDREQHGLRSRKLAQQGHDAGRHGAGLCRDGARSGAQQCHLQGVPLRAGQRGDRAVIDRFEEVGKGSECQRRLCLGRAAGERDIPSLAREGYALRATPLSCRSLNGRRADVGAVGRSTPEACRRRRWRMVPAACQEG